MVFRETLHAIRFFSFLPHADPNVGIDHIRSGNGLNWVARLADLGMRANVAKLGQKTCVQLVSFWRCHIELDIEQATGDRQATTNVVAVADVLGTPGNGMAVLPLEWR